MVKKFVEWQEQATSIRISCCCHTFLAEAALSETVLMFQKFLSDVLAGESSAVGKDCTGPQREDLKDRS